MRNKNSKLSESKYKNMKIGILTQPLHNNYGGLLQAYALKEVLKEMGHEVTIVNRQSAPPLKWRKYASIIKSKLIGRAISPNILMSQSLRDEISKETRDFRDKYFPELSHLITDQQGMNELNKMGFGAYIVGSDQCWRPRYSPSIRNYFLDFASQDKNVKRISFAASFGVSHWELTEEDTIACKELVQRFDAISVREDSAINLLADNLDRGDAIHVIDPTMLLTPKQYADIVRRENINSSAGNMKVYVLDKTPEKDDFIHRIEKRLKLKTFEVLPHKRLSDEKATKKDISEFAYPHPAQWLRGFQDAKFVVTDSFHGTVFSILHNIPFIAIGNKDRGLSRFESLLSMFGLSDRFITDFELVNIDELVGREIEWGGVNEVLDREREKAVGFLRMNLK